jgi:hypothetical protein
MKDIASYKPRYPNTSAVRKHIVEQFDLFDKDERHKFKWLRMKAHGLGDIKNRLTFDLACEADNEERFELETPRKAKQAKRSLDTDADTEGLPAKKSKPTDNGSINEPTEELTNNTIMDRFLGDDSIIPEKGADSVNATNSVYSNSNSNSNFGKACCHRGSIACGPHVSNASRHVPDVSTRHADGIAGHADGIAEHADSTARHAHGASDSTARHVHSASDDTDRHVCGASDNTHRHACGASDDTSRNHAEPAGEAEEQHYEYVWYELRRTCQSHWHSRVSS